MSSWLASGDYRYKAHFARKRSATPVVVLPSLCVNLRAVRVAHTHSIRYRE
ncbi:hypothetical protein BaRGS_00025951, partial [Batillaria attramentaria]